MNRLERLKQEMDHKPTGKCCRNELLYEGYRDHYDDPTPLARAYALKSLFTRHEKWIYDHDVIAGSYRGLFRDDLSDAQLKKANRVVGSYGSNSFVTNADHFAPDYATLLGEGIGGVLGRIAASRQRYAGQPEKELFLDSARISMESFSAMVGGYADAAQKKADEMNERVGGFADMARDLRHLTLEKPVTFYQASSLSGWRI
jgi:hypothetical protein